MEDLEHKSDVLEVLRRVFSSRRESIEGVERMSFAVTIEVLIDLPDAMNRTEAELKSQRLKEFLDEIAHNVIGTEITEITEYEVDE